MPPGRSPQSATSSASGPRPTWEPESTRSPPGWPGAEPRQAQAPGSGPGPARPAKPRRRVAGGERGGPRAAHLLVPAAAGRLHGRQRRQRQGHGAAGLREGGRTSELKGRGRRGRGVAERYARRGVRRAAAGAGTLSSGTERRRRGSAAAPGEEAGTTTTTTLLRRRPAPSAPRPAPPRRAAPLAPAPGSRLSAGFPS